MLYVTLSSEDKDANVISWLPIVFNTPPLNALLYVAEILALDIISTEFSYVAPFSIEAYRFTYK